MPEDLPPDFDPERYLAAFPDVALSGLDPAEHYLRFGRIMGRSPSPAPAARSATAQPSKAAKGPASAEVRPPEARARSDRAQPLIDRPADFNAGEVSVRSAPPKSGGENGRFALSDLREGALPEALAGLDAYQSMFEPGTGAGSPSLGAHELTQGPLRIDNAWLSPGNLLRLMLSDHAGEREGWTIRAYQADAAAPDALHLLGAGIQLPARGPVLTEFVLRNGLMPVIIELAEVGGAVRVFALLPFPSLLPGGMHAAELRALQPESNPMNASRSLSDLLLKELLGGPALPDFTIARLSRAEPTETVEPWLSALFGFAASGKDKLARPGGGRELTLPVGSIPTISALVSRSLDTDTTASATCPFLVADPDTNRPRWSVVLPADWDAGASAPVIDSGAAPAAHVAIAFRAQPVPKVPDLAETKKKGRAGRKISVLLDASDPQRAQASAQALQSALGSDLDLIVRMSGGEAVGSAWRSVPGNSNLEAVAAEARHPLLLTISDQVDLGDGSALDVLTDTMRDEHVASASCVLLHQVSLKKQKVMQAASGGLFPAAVSFAAAPSLSFAEPDVLQALPDVTYPVIANTLSFTLWRTEALAGLSLPPMPFPKSAEDVRIGLALADVGLRSLCTTKCSARVNGNYSPRDAIDPIGQVRLSRRNWEELLSRVTVLRQLF